MFKQRLVKLEMKDGTWKRLWNVQSLEEIKKYDYKNAYLSTSQWLSCNRLEHPTFKAHRIIIDTEIIIDLDNPSKQEVLEVQERMKIHHDEYKLVEVVKSSTKGLHLIYKLKHRPLIADPEIRLGFHNKERKRIAETLKGYNIDIPVLLDINRIRRCPLTWNGNKGCLAYEGSLYASLIGIAKMKKDISTKYLKQGEMRSNFPASYKFISNRASNIAKSGKRYMIKDGYFIHIKVKDLRQFRNVCSVYNIKHFVIRKNKDYFELISPKIVDFRRLVKILRYCKAVNLRPLQKYGHSWVRVSSILRNDKEEHPILNPEFEIMKNNEVGIAICQ